MIENFEKNLKLAKWNNAHQAYLDLLSGSFTADDYEFSVGVLIWIDLILSEQKRNIFAPDSSQIISDIYSDEVAEWFSSYGFHVNDTNGMYHIAL